MSVPIIDHVSLPVTDLERSRRFYDAVLAPLGIVPLPADARIAAYLREGPEEFLLISSDTPPAALPGLHVCFSAPSREAVREFHRAGLAAGGAALGEPGLRPHYGPLHFAAFLSDPDGHRIEAVSRAP